MSGQAIRIRPVLLRSRRSVNRQSVYEHRGSLARLKRIQQIEPFSALHPCIGINREIGKLGDIPLFVARLGHKRQAHTHPQRLRAGVGRVYAAIKGHGPNGYLLTVLSGNLVATLIMSGYRKLDISITKRQHARERTLTYDGRKNLRGERNGEERKTRHSEGAPSARTRTLGARGIRCRNVNRVGASIRFRGDAWRSLLRRMRLICALDPL